MDIKGMFVENNKYAGCWPCQKCEVDFDQGMQNTMIANIA